MFKRVLAVLIVSCLLAGTAAAQKSISLKGISLTPAVISLAVDQTIASTSFSVQLGNNLDHPVSLTLSSLDFKSLNESGGVAFISNGTSKYGLANWLQLPSGSVEIGAHSSRQVDVTVLNRADLSPGGHYAAVLFRDTADGSSGKNPVNVNQVVAALVFLKKSGGEVFSLQSQRPDFGWTALRLPSDLDLLIRNTGNTQTAPRGTIVITDPAGHEVKRGLVNPDSGLVLPDSTRLFRTTLFGVATAWLPGHYTATISYGPADTHTATTVSYSFFYLDPWLLAALVLLAIGSYRYRWHLEEQRLRKLRRRH